MRRIILGVAFFAAAAGEAIASPTMIRLGYSSCAACHISPQGGGLLNSYGRGIDEAQSRRAGDYRPSENDVVRALQWGGRITQDIRLVAQDEVRWASQQRTDNVFGPRLMYRNATALSRTIRVSASISAETESAPRPAQTYDSFARRSTLFVDTALAHYRPNETLELAVGRDQLPSGLNISDLTTLLKSTNRVGSDDAPTQLKMFWWGKRYHIAPFLYRSSRNGEPDEREDGAGTLAEFDLLGAQTTIVGLTMQHGTAQNGDRRLLGAYARLGFGRWGALAEHDVTDRMRGPERTSGRQTVTFGQVFWAAREWLIASATGERLDVQQPYESRLASAKLEMTARLTSQFSIGGVGKVQYDRLTGMVVKSIAFHAAFKTVH